MKKIYSLLLLAVSSISLGQTIFSENMGTTAVNNPLITAHTGWQNSSPIVFTGTADVRTTLVSSGYTGASGNCNVFINAVDEFFQIDGINTSAYNTSGLQLSFGINTPSPLTNVLTVEVSTDATNWTPLTYTPSSTGWSLATITSGIPSTTTLSIRFKSTSTAQFRIDDVRVFNFNASCTLVLGTATTACSAVTTALDTYTATIPYTGGGSGSYTIVTSSGTVGGDNPATVAQGNITISGIVEGTNLAVTITSGSCSYTANVNAPECKPVNTLPFNEPFAYAEGTSIGQTQQWSNVNTGDNITVGNSSLTYPGFTTAGNSVSFAADGVDCFTSFTPTTSETIYYSYLLNITSMAGVTDTNGGYFSGFGSSTTSLGATLWAKRVDDTSYNLGIEVRTANGANTTYSTDTFTAGQTYFVVVGYTFGPNASDDTVNLWINPALNGAQPAASLTDSHTGTDFTEISNFFLRQDSATETGATQIDELRIGTTWAQVTSGSLRTTQNQISGLKVYPNPVANGTLFIETAANAEKTVAIFDVLGKQVLNTTTADNAVNVSGLNAGVYVVRITEEGKTATTKLVIK